MKERPILFSGEMIRAILDGTKTQTRRIVKQCKDSAYGCQLAPYEVAGEINAGDYSNCKYGQPGDRLWVRETFAVYGDEERYVVHYKATHQNEGSGWKPSIHMPRRVSRITLEIVSVRVERLQDISEADARAEGIKEYPFRPDDGWPICAGYTHLQDDGKCTLHPTAATAFKKLWESINGTGSWDKNPWVWVIEFRRLP